MKRNAFLNAALEELEKGTPVEQDDGEDVSKVTATGNKEAGATTVEFDAGADAVAELMEKNSELADSKATLESETFDNDLDSIQTVSDSVTQDLDEAVNAGIALEQLAYLTELSIKTNQANAASNAGYFMALEHICARADMHDVTAALEESALQLEGPKAQAEHIGKLAIEKSNEIGKKIVEGIKRIVGWLLNAMRQMFSRLGSLPKRIQAAAAQLDSIDESKTIDSKPFIASLRLVEGAGDPDKQFANYAQLANKTLYGFFNERFSTHMTEAADALLANLAEDTADEANAGFSQLKEVLRTLMSVVFTEHADTRDVAVSLPKDVSDRDLTVGKTVPCIGGVQLYLAATLDGGDHWFCRAGLAKEQGEIAMPATIPLTNKSHADKMFKIITTWAQHEHALQKNLAKLQSIRGFSNGVYIVNKQVGSKAVSAYMAVLTAIATSVIPHFMRLNVQNAVNYVTYVEKSIAVSKASYATK